MSIYIGRHGDDAVYHIAKIPPICCISAIFSQKSRYVVVPHSVFGTQVGTSSFDWL